MSSILWLGDPACHERSTVGGKAANLSRLAAGFRVPDGFCLVAEEGGEDALPAPLAEELDGAYTELGRRRGQQDPPVAVRSSAVDEDGETASFAGQHETYLNITGPQAVREAVLRCWASGRTDRVLEYRARHGLALASRPLPVLVQSLIVADTSAVVFTVNPVTGDRDEVVVNATWGLGESLVGGTVTPDSFVVRRDDLELVRRDVSSKARMTVGVPGGTREVEVPFALREQPAASDDDVRAMAELGLELERQFGWPVDIECAWADGELYLLQCRAVTALPTN